MTSLLKSILDINSLLQHNRRRVIALIDLDCFYAQVEGKRLGIPPSTPLVVQQWGAVIAVNYSVRPFGVKRGDSVGDIKKKCPQCVLSTL